MALFARPDAAFTAYAAEGQHRLYRQAYLLCGNAETARDLTQATLLKVYLAWSRIEHPPAYGSKILVRLFLDGERRRRREATVPADPEPHASDPAVVLTLRQALDELPPRMRAVVVLRFWEDLSVREVAGLLGCTDGTVKSQTHKALAHLRATLGDSFALTTQGELS